MSLSAAAGVDGEPRPDLIEVLEPLHVAEAPPPEGNVKLHNYRLVQDNLRVYSPTGDVHTSPVKGKLVSRFEVCSTISPPRAKILELLRPEDPGRDALEEIVKPAPRRGFLNTLDEDSRIFLQRALLSPSPRMSEPTTPEPRTMTPEPESRLPLEAEGRLPRQTMTPEPANLLPGQTMTPEAESRLPRQTMTPEPASRLPRQTMTSEAESRLSKQTMTLETDSPLARQIMTSEPKCQLPRQKMTLEPKSRFPRQMSLAEELHEAERGKCTNWFIRDGWPERKTLQAVCEPQRHTSGASCGTARRLDALLAESRSLHSELADIHADIQCESARAVRCAAAARRLAAEARGLSFLDDVLALLRGDVAAAARAHAWPFAVAPRDPDRNYVI